MKPSIKHCLQAVNLQTCCKLIRCIHNLLEKFFQYEEIFVSRSLAFFLLYADKCTSQLSQDAFSASNNEKLIMKLWSGDTGLTETTTKSSVRPILLVNGSVLLRISMSTHRSSRSTIKLWRWGYFPTHDANKIDFDSCWFSLTLNFDEYTSQFSMKLWSGDNRLRETTTMSSVRPILIVNGSVLLPISTSTHRSSRSTHSLELIEKSQPIGSVLLRISTGTHCGSPSTLSTQINLRSGDTRLRERTTKTVLRPTFTVTSTVVLWTSTRELRKFRGEHSCKLICEVGILARERGKQRRAFDRLLQLLGQLCFGLRRGNLENFSVALLAMGILARERGKQRRAFDRLLQLLGQLCFELRRGNLENFLGNIPASINELILYSLFASGLICEVGVLARERGKQRRAFDRLLQLLGQLCFELRRRNLENFSVALLASINEYILLICEVGILARERGKQRRAFDRLLQLLGQLCFGLRRGNLENFSVVLLAILCTINLRSGDTRPREGKTKTGLRPTLTVIRSVVLWTSTRELRKYFGRSSSNILYNLFDFRLICEVGILARERGKQRRAFDRLLQLLGQLCFELRRRNLENFSVALLASINEYIVYSLFDFRGDTGPREGKTKTGLRPTLTVIRSVVLWTSTRELRKFFGRSSSNILYNLFDFKLICEVGILARERGKQRRAFDRLLQLLGQLCFELRRGNLENFLGNIPASINELILYSLFASGLICEVGVLARERGKQRRAFDRLLQLLGQLCFELRRRNLENFSVALLASINEYILLICEVGILARERGKQRRAFDRLLQLLGQLCFGLRRGNLENFSVVLLAILCTINLRSGDTRPREGKTKTGLRPTLTVIRSVVLWTSTRELRKYFGRSSSNILYNLFDFRLICEVGILARERGKQRRAFDRLLQLLGQLCFELRRRNLENFSVALLASINEYIVYSLFDFRGDTGPREGKTKTGLRPTLTVIRSVVLWTSTRELRKFPGEHSCNGDTRSREGKTKTGLRPTLTVI
ncbi:hypothetical protein V1477_015035, partial [Vespula maculifrons]